jgi:hypothetical protein
MTPARLAARVMRPLLRGRRIVIVGRKVAEAFELPMVDWFEPFQLHCGPRHAVTGCNGMAEAMVIPHPSGRNHWYNSETNRALARRALRGLVENSALADRKVLPFAQP